MHSIWNPRLIPACSCSMVLLSASVQTCFMVTFWCSTIELWHIFYHTSTFHASKGHISHFLKQDTCFKVDAATFKMLCDKLAEERGLYLLMAGTIDELWLHAGWFAAQSSVLSLCNRTRYTCHDTQAALCHTSPVSLKLKYCYLHSKHFPS